MAITAIVVLATGGKRLRLISLEHMQALRTQDDLPERCARHPTIGEGDVTAPADHAAGRNGDQVVNGTGEPVRAAKRIAVGLAVGRNGMFASPLCR